MSTLSSPMKGDSLLLDRFSVGFKDHIREVCSFAKSIPGFKSINYEDQVILLKAAVFEVTLVKLSLLFHNGSMKCFNGEIVNRETIKSMPDGKAKFVTTSILEITEKIKLVGLSEAESGLFSSVIIITPDRSSLKNPEILGKMQSTLKFILWNSLVLNHPQPQTVFNKLMTIMYDLQNLNTLYSQTVLQEKSQQKGSISINLNKNSNISQWNNQVYENGPSLDKKDQMFYTTKQLYEKDFHEINAKTLSSPHSSKDISQETVRNLQYRYPLLKRALEQPSATILMNKLSKGPGTPLKPSQYFTLNNLSGGPDLHLKRSLEHPDGSLLLDKLSGVSDPLLVRPHKKFRHGERREKMSHFSQYPQQIQKRREEISYVSQIQKSPERREL